LNAAFDLLGRRWALRILWELREGRLTFRGLQERCGGISPTVLNQRIRELRETNLVDASPGEGYELTALGGELGRALAPLHKWAERWKRVQS
jgi:DNA-binding HxlR family transcriptional regulator